MLPDRIEAGTYACAVAMTGGDVLLEGASEALLPVVLDVLRQTGATIVETPQGLRVSRQGGTIRPVDVTTAPFPGFPTDLQAQFMALMTRAEGTSRITETIFENRFMHVQELARLGARIRLEGDAAIVAGRPVLKGAPVMATDLRASVSLVIAALAAEGETLVHRVYHLDRGFERLEEKLVACGANVERLREGGGGGLPPSWRGATRRGDPEATRGASGSICFARNDGGMTGRTSVAGQALSLRRHQPCPRQ